MEMHWINKRVGFNQWTWKLFQMDMYIYNYIDMEPTEGLKQQRWQPIEMKDMKVSWKMGNPQHPPNLDHLEADICHLEGCEMMFTLCSLHVLCMWSCAGKKPSAFCSHIFVNSIMLNPMFGMFQPPVLLVPGFFNINAIWGCFDPFKSRCSRSPFLRCNSFRKFCVLLLKLLVSDQTCAQILMGLPIGIPREPQFTQFPLRIPWFCPGSPRSSWISIRKSECLSRKLPNLSVSTPPFEESGGLRWDWAPSELQLLVSGCGAREGFIRGAGRCAGHVAHGAGGNTWYRSRPKKDTEHSWTRKEYNRSVYIFIHYFCWNIRYLYVSRI